MENYRKGKNVEEPLEREKIPIAHLPDDFLWMQVRGGSKIRNLLTYALQEFPKTKSVIWTGFGQSVGKAVTCAEIMKREYENELHQITKLCYRLIEEYWEPLTPELDQLVVKRKLPMIHIYLSIKTLNNDEFGYQAPGVFIPYHSNTYKRRHPNRNQQNKNNKSQPSTSSNNNVKTKKVMDDK